MKNILFTLLLFSAFHPQRIISQLEKISADQLIEAEAKAAQALINFKVNINTANYDITYHKLEWTVDPSSAFISGVVTTNFIAKSDLNQITFDLANNMLVSNVTQNGISLSYSQNTNDELVITLASTVNQGASDSVKITYSGNPVSSGFGSFEQTTHNGSPIIWTLSEPYGAKGWWPCKQDLNDKIDVIDVYITTPQFNALSEENFAVSNGLEQSQTIVGADKITHFKHQYPIPAYLIALAVTNYSIYTHQVANNGNPFDIVNYVYPENLTSAQASTGITVNLIDLYTQLFEEYPFSNEKYGHAQFSWGGGMEHTTVSFMVGFNRDLIAHELAHQWFGDKITCGSWKDIWLNESFATFLTGLSIENLDGNLSYKNWRINNLNSITSQAGGSVYLSDADTTSVSRIFDGRLSYRKGAMVLHMLRKKLGDTVFFQGMKAYLADATLAYDYAKTSDFISVMESNTGQDLTEFFNDWIFDQGYPSYNLSWYQPQPNQLSVTVNQSQSHPSVSYFEAPLPIRVHGSGGEIIDLILNNTFNNEVFLETVNFQVIQIEVDPEKDLISKNNTTVLGIADEAVFNQLIIYPNPVANLLHIKTPLTVDVREIVIFNTLGQVEKISAPTQSLDVSDLNEGLYFLKIKTDKGPIHQVFLKE
jgi:aminopeptidase N